MNQNNQFLHRSARLLRGHAREFLHHERNKGLFTLYKVARKLVAVCVLPPLYSAALLLQIPWPAAYFWRVQTLIDKLSQLIESENYNLGSADKLRVRAGWYLEHLERTGHRSPRVMEFRSSISFLSGNTNEFIEAQLAIFDYQETLAQSHQSKAPNLRVLEPHFHILVGIGSTVHLDAYVKAGILNLRPPTRAVILHEPWLRKYAVNPCLLSYWKQYIEIVEDQEQLELLRPFRRDLAFNVCGPMRCGDQIIPWAHSAVAYVQQIWDSQQRAPLLQLTDDHRARGTSLLKSVGLASDEWFVTMHVREGKFGDHRFKELFRDSEPITYIPAIEAVTDRGGWVIRIGDPSTTPLPKLPRVIDYAHSSFKSDWMDVFLLGNARFMIGTSSGPATVSRAFGVPIAMTNYLQASTLYLGQHDIFLPRLMKHLANGELLSFEQQMSLPYSAGFSDGMFRNIQQVEVIPNTPDEIRELIEEMLDRFNGTLMYSLHDSELQNRFKHITANRETLIGLRDTALQCRIGRHFLRRHQALFNK